MGSPTVLWLSRSDGYSIHLLTTLYFSVRHLWIVYCWPMAPHFCAKVFDQAFLLMFHVRLFSMLPKQLQIKYSFPCFIIVLTHCWPCCTVLSLLSQTACSSKFSYCILDAVHGYSVRLNSPKILLADNVVFKFIVYIHNLSIKTVGGEYFPSISIWNTCNISEVLSFSSSCLIMFNSASLTSFSAAWMSSLLGQLEGRFLSLSYWRVWCKPYLFFNNYIQMKEVQYKSI